MGQGAWSLYDYREKPIKQSGDNQKQGAGLIAVKNLSTFHQTRIQEVSCNVCNGLDRNCARLNLPWIGMQTSCFSRMNHAWQSTGCMHGCGRYHARTSGQAPCESNEVAPAPPGQLQVGRFLTCMTRAGNFYNCFVSSQGRLSRAALQTRRTMQSARHLKLCKQADFYPIE